MFVGVPAPPGGKFLTPLTVPVDTVAGKPASRSFAALHPPKPFTFRLQDVVVAASRFLFVHTGGPAPAPNIVQEWQTILAWEIEQFWIVDFPTNSLQSIYASAGIFTSEHSTRSGEHVAAGIALLYIDQLPWMTLAACDFFADPAARPDFVLPIVLANNKRVGLEARCRQYAASLDKGEVDSIEAKKKHPLFDNILAVYFQYGDPMTKNSSVTKHKSRTRLLTLDPEGRGEVQPESVRKMTILKNYLRICEEIGLPRYSRYLRRAIEALTLSTPMPKGREQEFVLRPNALHSRVKLIGGSHYIGRDFSSLLAESTGLRADERRALLESSGLGNYGFVGINAEILRAINDSDWTALFAFRDELAHTEATGAATILSDGYCATWRRITDPNSVEATNVRKSM